MVKSWDLTEPFRRHPKTTGRLCQLSLRTKNKNHILICMKWCWQNTQSLENKKVMIAILPTQILMLKKDAVWNWNLFWLLHINESEYVFFFLKENWYPVLRTEILKAGFLYRRFGMYGFSKVTLNLKVPMNDHLQIMERDALKHIFLVFKYVANCIVTYRGILICDTES